MRHRLHLAAAALLTLSAAFVGAWAAFAPRSFYDSFPGLGRQWVSSDGPFNDHLIRDVGAFYLALFVAGALVLCWRDARSLQLLGATWTVFNVLHFGYHADHLDMLRSFDKVGELGMLGLTLVLSLLLLVPAPGRTMPKEVAR